MRQTTKIDINFPVFHSSTKLKHTGSCWKHNGVINVHHPINPEHKTMAYPRLRKFNLDKFLCKYTFDTWFRYCRSWCRTSFTQAHSKAGIIQYLGFPKTRTNGFWEIKLHDCRYLTEPLKWFELKLHLISKCNIIIFSNKKYFPLHKLITLFSPHYQTKKGKQGLSWDAGKSPHAPKVAFTTEHGYISPYTCASASTPLSDAQRMPLRSFTVRLCRIERTISE